MLNLTLTPHFSAFSFAAGGRDRQGEPGASFLPHARQDKAYHSPEAGGRF